MQKQQIDLNFKAPPTGAKFMSSTAFLRGLMGPVGSGKSTVCCWELMRRAIAQEAGPDGVARTRWGVIRKTYGELKNTTIKTFQDWFPPHVFPGRYSQTPPITQTISFEVDGKRIEAEFIFLALDRAEDAEKLKSMEFTGIWINEASEIEWAIIQAAIQRVGRYPSKRMGGPTWFGVIMDTNPPDNKSWWYSKFEKEKPEGWAIFKQPSGRSPEAENKDFLPANYYEQIVASNDEDVVKVMVDGQYGFIKKGVGVFDKVFNHTLHVSDEELKPLPVSAGKPVVVGIDFGLTPAAIFMQSDAKGRWYILYELVPEELMGAMQFAPLVKQVMKQYFDPNQDFIFGGDPAGAQKQQNDARSCFDEFRSQGIDVKPSPTQNITERLDCIRSPLLRLIDGGPGIVISKACTWLVEGFNGGYHYKALRVGGSNMVHETPNKNEFSHPMDALQYGLAIGGEYNLIKRKGKGFGSRPVVMKNDWSIW